MAVSTAQDDWTGRADRWVQHRPGQRNCYEMAVHIAAGRELVQAQVDRIVELEGSVAELEAQLEEGWRAMRALMDGASEAPSAELPVAIYVRTDGPRGRHQQVMHGHACCEELWPSREVRLYVDQPAVRTDGLERLLEDVAAAKVGDVWASVIDRVAPTVEYRNRILRTLAAAGITKLHTSTRSWSTATGVFAS